MAARLVKLAMSPQPAGRSRWTTRLLAKQVRLTAGCVSDVLRRNGLKPHLVRTYKVSLDPDFAAKVTDVVGLYLNPPEHAVVLSVDEKTDGRQLLLQVDDKYFCRSATVLTARARLPLGGPSGTRDSRSPDVHGRAGQVVEKKNGRGKDNRGCRSGRGDERA